MSNYLLVTDVKDATKHDSQWEVVSEFRRKGKEVTVNGVSYSICSKEQRTYSLIWRVALSVGSIFLAGLPFVCSKKMREICFKGRQSVYFAVPPSALPISNKPTSQLSLSEEVNAARQLDQVYNPTDPSAWKVGPGRNEVEQTFEAFKTNADAQENAQKNKINIFLMTDGKQSFSEKEKKALKIVSEYLQAVHGLKTVVVDHPLVLDDRGKREKEGRQQYGTLTQFLTLGLKSSKDTFSFGFTNQDLYNGIMNYVYGTAELGGDRAVVSTHRLIDKDFNTTLIRLMKVAAHEFAHNRGMEHCTKYSCNIQGYNNLSELDKSPLTFCAEDMAKICYLNHWSLREGYVRQLKFFEKLAKKYNLPLSDDIAHLKSKIWKIDAKKCFSA